MAEKELGAFGKKRLKAKLRFFRRSKKYANLTKEEKTKIALAMIKKEDADLAKGRADRRQADIDKAKSDTGVDLNKTTEVKKNDDKKDIFGTPKSVRDAAKNKKIKEIEKGKNKNQEVNKPKPKTKLKRTMSGFKPVKERKSQGGSILKSLQKAGTALNKRKKKFTVKGRPSALRK